MIRKDFHGLLLTEALQEVDTMVSRVRLMNTSTDACLITGNGHLKGEMMKYLTEYGLQPSEQLGNSGAIRVVIE